MTKVIKLKKVSILEKEVNLKAKLGDFFNNEMKLELILYGDRRSVMEGGFVAQFNDSDQSNEIYFVIVIKASGSFFFVNFFNN